MISHERRVFQVGQPGAAIRFRQEQVPQPGGLGLGLQLLDQLAAAASGPRPMGRGEQGFSLG